MSTSVLVVPHGVSASAIIAQIKEAEAPCGTPKVNPHHWLVGDYTLQIRLPAAFKRIGPTPDGKVRQVCCKCYVVKEYDDTLAAGGFMGDQGIAITRLEDMPEYKGRTIEEIERDKQDAARHLARQNESTHVNSNMAARMLEVTREHVISALKQGRLRGYQTEGARRFWFVEKSSIEEYRQRKRHKPQHKAQTPRERRYPWKEQARGE